MKKGMWFNVAVSMVVCLSLFVSAMAQGETDVMGDEVSLYTVYLADSQTEYSYAALADIDLDGEVELIACWDASHNGMSLHLVDFSPERGFIITDAIIGYGSCLTLRRDISDNLAWYEEYDEAWGGYQIEGVNKLHYTEGQGFESTPVYMVGIQADEADPVYNYEVWGVQTDEDGYQEALTSYWAMGERDFIELERFDYPEKWQSAIAHHHQRGDHSGE